MAFGHRIMVPLDGSPLAERALPLATTVSRHTDGALLLVGVHSPWIVGDVPPAAGVMVGDAERHARADLERYLEEVAASLETRDGMTVEVEVRMGGVDTELLDACERGGCDLIVMSTHGRGGFDRLWLGSVADRVARGSSVPVLLVSARGREDADEPPAEEPRPLDVRTIVVPLDGSEFSASALEPATALGRAFDADYILFRAVSPVSVVGVSTVANAEKIMAEMKEVERAEARSQLDREADRLRSAGHTVSVIVAEDDPVASLLRLGRATPGSVIAMTTHGRGGVRRAIIGSVADKVVRASSRPVLLVRPPGKDGRD